MLLRLTFSALAIVGACYHVGDQEKGNVMLNDRLKAVIERAALLPATMQDELATVIEEALAQMARPRTQLSTEWRVSVERAMREQSETLEYLKDR